MSETNRWSGPSWFRAWRTLWLATLATAALVVLLLAWTAPTDAQTSECSETPALSEACADGSDVPTPPTN